jgi:hypothetical protein
MANNAEIRKAVSQFLLDFKAVAASQKPYVIDRQKNQDTLLALGLTLTNQWHILLQLEVEDYVSGPEQDRQRAGDVWVFGKQLAVQELYIKIKLAEYIPLDTGQRVRKAVCISFHIAEQPLVYPLKQRLEG